MLNVSGTLQRAVVSLGNSSWDYRHGMRNAVPHRNLRRLTWRGIACRPRCPIMAEAMAKKSKKKGVSKDADKNQKRIAENRKARREYEIIDTLECGIVLVGSEVKSLRNGKVSLDEAYGRIRDGEVWLVNCDIAEYEQANLLNLEPKRPRKLLLHRREIHKFAGKAFERGLTLVPLKMYFKEGRAKLLLGIGRGRKLYDKREKLKKDTVKRDLDRAMRSRR